MLRLMELFGTIMRFAWIPVILLFILGANAFRAMMARAHAESSPQLVVGNLAQSLGLTVVEGDPSLHLAVGPRPAIWAALLGLQMIRFDVRMEGVAHGASVRFTLHRDFRRLKLRRMVLFERNVYDATLTIAGVRSGAPFEAWLEPASPYMRGRPSRQLPPVHTGQSSHGPWHLTSTDPASAHALVPILARFAEHGYLHVVGANDEVKLVMTEIALTTLAGRLPELRDGLIELASAAQAGARATPHAP